EHVAKYVTIDFTHAGGFRGRMREDMADRDGALLLLDLHPDAGVLAVGLLREARELLGGEQLAVRVVELLHDDARSLLIKGTLADRVDESRRHELEHLIEHACAIGRRTV